MKQRIVLAFGGNALQKNGENTADAQKKIAETVGEAIADLAQKYEIIIVHGNGPQIGNILIHEESAASAAAPAMPLETAVAMSQGQIGYWLTQAINNAFIKRGRSQKIATIISQVVVNRSDPAFKNPTKPIGQFYDKNTARALARKNHWMVKEDAGRGWRRVVASPKPVDIVEKKTIIELAQNGVIVIAAGGGGIPVVRTKVLKRLKGIDAVIDKDYAAEKLAELTRADIFASITAVPNVYLNFNTPTQTALSKISAAELKKLIKDGHFKPGSMLPKVEAAIKFSTHKTRKLSLITDIEHLSSALDGSAGTIITA